ncbi:hypothetical protein D3C72_960550 [compost metagenome]
MVLLSIFCQGGRALHSGVQGIAQRGKPLLLGLWQQGLCKSALIAERAGLQGRIPCRMRLRLRLLQLRQVAVRLLGLAFQAGQLLVGALQQSGAIDQRGGQGRCRRDGCLQGQQLRGSLLPLPRFLCALAGALLLQGKLLRQRLLLDVVLLPLLPVMLALL